MSRARAGGAGALWALAAGCAAGVVALYRLAVGTAPGQRLDERLRGGIGFDQARLLDAGNDLLNTISVAGLALVGLVVMGVALARRMPRLALGAGALVAGANVTVQVMKRELERPALTDQWWAAANSFPSGHATVAMSLAMALVLVSPPALRAPAAVAGAVYACAVGVAVIGLDWHRPSDVVGAYLVVGAWAGVTAALLASHPDRAARRAPRRARAAPWGIALAVALGLVAAAGGVRAAADPDVARLVADRTGLVVAGLVTSAAGCLVIAVFTALLARARARPRGRS
jgi:membrane-associated phospholipid phosphatase